LWTFIWSFCTWQNVVTVQRRVWRYQRGNQNPYIEEEQTTQWPKEKGQTRIYKTYHKRADKIYVLLFIQLLHIFISFNPGTTHQTSQSQAMQVWAHLRPRSPLHISLDLLSALHLNHGHSRASPAILVSGWGKRGRGLLHWLWQKFN
jgi:hypothetical protein